MRFFSVLEADIKLLACQKTMEYEKPVELWANYPQDCDAFNPLVSDAEACNSRFRELSSVLFNDEKFDVRLISLAVRSLDWKPLSYLESEQKCDQAMEKAQSCPFRIVSIFQGDSLSPLQCTRSTMLKILHRCNVDPAFLDILFKFGDQDQVFEESSGLSYASCEPDGSFVLCYQLLYIEPNGRPSPKDPWSLRQTGVYQKYSRSGNCTFGMLLHPNSNSVAQTRLETAAETRNENHGLREHPLNMHLIILSSYFNHWQAYIESLAAEVGKIRDKVQVVNVEEGPLKAEMLQHLRNLEDKVVLRTLGSIRSSISIVELLAEVNRKLKAANVDLSEQSAKMDQHLSAYLNRLRSHLSNAEILEKRVQATIGLLSNLLDLRNQATSDKTNCHMLQLTREGVDDNATVRVITVFTLIYLPASFIATLFGTNLFDFEAENGGILRVSPSFWIYICASIPLTAVTLITWYLFKLRHDKLRREKREKGLWLP